LASSLKQLSKSVKNKNKYIPKHNLIKNLHDLEQAILDYENDLGKIPASEGVFMLTTMLQYAEKQIEKIKIVERAFSLAILSEDLKGKDKDLEKFLTPQHYLEYLDRKLKFFINSFQTFFKTYSYHFDWIFDWQNNTFSKRILDFAYHCSYHASRLWINQKKIFP
jgi:hypothetical protein